MGTSKAGATIWAGLVGSSLWMVPGQAWGRELGMSEVLADPELSFLLGCVSGAMVTGVAAALITAAGNRKARAEAEADLTGTHVMDRSATKESHAEQDATAIVSEAAPQAASETVGTAGKGIASPEVPADAQSAAHPQTSPSAAIPFSHAAAPDDEAARRREILSRVPRVDPAPVVPLKDSSDELVDFAQNYARQESDSKREHVRSRGVRAILSERIGKTMFDDLPVIQRADGSVGDVGTGWWDMTLGDQVRRVGEAASGEAAPVAAAQQAPSASAQLTVPGWVKESQSAVPQESQQQAAAEPQMAGSFHGRAPKSEAQKRSEYIAKNIAEIDEGVYPAHRDPEELEHEDMWEQALAAMSRTLEQTPQEEPVFADVVGGSDSIDDPEGLEPSTSFIPFRVPAAHPEVVDTESYVDYLIDDEFSRNTSQAARKSSRDYLRVLQGGTQTNALRGTHPLRGRTSHQAASESYHPKHMARRLDAQEA